MASADSSCSKCERAVLLVRECEDKWCPVLCARKLTKELVKLMKTLKKSIEVT